MSIHVNVDNFARAESDRMLSDLAGAAGGVNRWTHVRRPTPIGGQTVIRMNRDTLYSFAVVDLSEPATVTLPDAGDRYLSVMVVNQDHYINTMVKEMLFFLSAYYYNLDMTLLNKSYILMGTGVILLGLRLGLRRVIGSHGVD